MHVVMSYSHVIDGSRVRHILQLLVVVIVPFDPFETAKFQLSTMPLHNTFYKVVVANSSCNKEARGLSNLAITKKTGISGVDRSRSLNR